MNPPHSGFHGTGIRGGQRFFEGWFYRISLPACCQSFALMHSIDDPQGGTAYAGGMIQVLGMGDRPAWRTLPNVHTFYADPNSLDYGHTGSRGTFYHVQGDRHWGCLHDPVQSFHCQWDFRVTPIHTWGQNQATMGLLSYLPIFEPGWQILMAHGWANGWLRWQEQHFDLIHAPAYAEKNWGRSFPERWFWIQCNAFPDRPNLSITAAGGVRSHLGRTSLVAMVSLHNGSEVLSFAPSNSQIYCHVQPWGTWHLAAFSPTHSLELWGETSNPGGRLLVPTAEGLRFLGRETGTGTLRITWDDGKTYYSAASSLAALEVGGRGWEEPWQFTSARF
ncbi:MAG: tocopherol cyclase [Oscillatoriales cyanobacterium SM2_2_1]|nr:tocopherol cyclase [Oscillatoriales cyanobacterium SM2_2_1]